MLETRTAALATLVFLSINGVKSLPTPEAVERMTVAVASSKVGKAELTEWTRSQIGAA